MVEWPRPSPRLPLFTQVPRIGILGSCPVGSCIALRPGYPSGCPGLAFLMRVLLAALFCLAPVRQRGLSLCAPSALRGTSGGATMTTPGEAGMVCTILQLAYVLGAPASIMGSELSVYLAPALRSAPSRCPKPSLTLTPAVGA
jgi:hypothetical protein